MTYFFYHLDGKGDAANMIAFLREVENVKNDAESEAAVKKHLLRERSYEQLADEVKKAFRKEGVTIEFFPPGKNGPKSSAQ
jgi:predicted metallo-beta-lactamase superfamily hydrolase